LCIEAYLDWKAELNEHENEIWEVGRVMTEDRCLLGQARVIWGFLNLAKSLLVLNLLLFILEISKTYISFICIKVFSLSPQSFHFGYFAPIYFASSLMTSTYLFFKSFLYNISYIELFELWMPFLFINSIKVTNYGSECWMLITNYIYL